MFTYSLHGVFTCPLCGECLHILYVLCAYSHALHVDVHVQMFFVCCVHVHMFSCAVCMRTCSPCGMFMLTCSLMECACSHVLHVCSHVE